MTAASSSAVFPARAKLNVRLEVLARQPGGLHGIRSLIGDLGIADEIELIETPGDFSVETEGADIPERENLVWLAATRLGVDLSGLRVRIRKRIPMQAGLGGGSADTAAVLRALIARFANRATPIPEENVRSAMSVGSDVPACMVPGFKIVEGTGDSVKPVSIQPPPWGVLLLRPAVGVPTSEAYRLLDAARAETSPMWSEVEVLEMCRAIALRDFARACELLHNDFQPVIELIFPSVAEARERLRATGAAATLLCGSGSCVAGLFIAREVAVTARESLVTLPGEWAAATGFASA
jgi:4-diphosphocytidyl-2-C-methyl-D-erythritol kinase